ncbi:hypothetical protein ACHAQA_009915 [Verticillium albo-atrum]
MYNLARIEIRRLRYQKTFFQQKWAAKSLTRGYHGGTMREGDWERMFSRRLLGTVDISPEYLARYDGSEQAAGRGSGKQRDPNDLTPAVSADQYSQFLQFRQRRDQREADDPPRYSNHVNIGRIRRGDDMWIKTNDVAKNMTPYMQMTYAPLERRLEVAIFRAMFASSTLQARQFCIHGAVKVNGQPMRSPGYLLNPGDMFQVDIERVLYATGKPKNPKEVARLDKLLKEREEREAAAEAKDAALRAAKRQELADKLKAGEQGGGSAPSAEASEQAAGDTAVEAETEAAVEAAATEASTGLGEDGEPMTEDELAAQHKRQLKKLIQDAKTLLKDNHDNMGAKHKQRVRLFLSEAKRAISRLGKNAAALDGEADLSRDSVMTQLATILKGLNLDHAQQAKAEAEAAENPEAAAEGAEGVEAAPKTWEQELQTLTKQEQDALALLLREDADNPVDETKPYLTPWQPRRYLAPFAFIPRYLEVNQNICAAVYLRHPVARRGEAEVPTPFPIDQNQLAFNWYLRRR